MVLQGGPCGRVGRRRTIVGRRAPHHVRGPSSFPVPVPTNRPVCSVRWPASPYSADGSERAVVRVCYVRRRAPIAQSVERLHGKEKVYGSIPYWGSTTKGLSSVTRALSSFRRHPRKGAHGRGS